MAKCVGCGILAESAIRADCSPKHDAGFCHSGGNGVIRFLRKALMEQVVPAPHASNVAFIEGAATARSKKPADVV